MHGDGVDLLKTANSDMDMQSKIINLKDQKVAFQVCNNTLKGRKISYKNDLYDVSESDIVPSGVAEISNPDRPFLLLSSSPPRAGFFLPATAAILQLRPSNDHAAGIRTCQNCLPPSPPWKS